MIVDRLDKGCRAKILGTYSDRVLIDAFWPATAMDRRKGLVGKDGSAHNVVEVSREYFDKKYGAVL